MMNASCLTGKTLLIVEDEDDVRTGIKEVLSSLLDINILDAPNAKIALEIVRNRNVNAILTDIRMPEMDGIEFISCAKVMGIDIPVIFFSAYADKDIALKALRLGAFEFIEKPFRMNDLAAVIKAALMQDQQTVVSKLQGLNLSEKQADILELLLQGKTNRDIAEAMQLAEPTVKYHVGNFFKQFSATNRSELRDKIWSLVNSKAAPEFSNTKGKFL